MKAIVISSILLVATWSWLGINGDSDAVESPVKCPPLNGVNATLLPNPKNCGSYYVCDWGRPILMKCPKGLEFNNKLKVCDWPWRANCKVSKPEIPEKPENPEIPENPEKPGKPEEPETPKKPENPEKPEE